METIHSDVLVVGAGLAGFTAAVRASEQGAKVILIDKSHGELGDGNILMASGSLRAGGKSPRTNSNELYDFVMTWTPSRTLKRNVDDFSIQTA